MQVLDILEFDETHVSEGYVIVKHRSLPENRMKLMVNGLYYDLYRHSVQTVIPLTSGSCRYRFTLYQPLSENSRRYLCKGSIIIDAKLEREDAAFLHANQYVDYDDASLWVIKARELCRGLNESEAYRQICKYIKSNLTYDYVRAFRVKPNTLPDLKSCWENKMGICQDLAALTASMLRTCGISAKLVIGYADINYHAWVEATVDGIAKLFDPAAAITGAKVKRYKIERVY